MPHKRKDSNYWWASFTDSNGKRVRRSTGTTSYTEAKAIESRLRSAAWEEQQWGRAPEVSFAEVIVPYLRYAQAELKSWKELQYQSRKLREHFSNKEMTRLSAKDIEAYKEARREEGVSNATINRELSCLSAAINRASKLLDLDLPNPVKSSKLKEPQGRVRWITRAESEALCRSALQGKDGKLLQDFIRLALNTGCRMNELLGLEWNRVDFANQLVILEGEHTKAGKRRSIPLNKSALIALKSRMSARAEYCPDSPWVFTRKNGQKVTCLRVGFKNACARVGIGNFRIHDLRHTCAAWLVTAGVPLSEVRDLLGHSTVMMTERYAHLAPARVKAAVNLLDGEAEMPKSRFGHGVVQEVKFGKG